MPCGRSIERLFKCFRQEKRYVFVISAVSILLFFILPSDNHLTKSNLSLSTISGRDKTTAVLNETANISVAAAGSLNTSVLLQNTINELEADGWIAPIGKGGVSRRLWKMKATMHIRKSEANLQETEEIVLAAERWKISHMGCFYDVPKTSALTSQGWATEVSSAKECIERCDKEERLYASISNGRTCKCGKQILKFSVSVPVLPSLCNIKCKLDQDWRQCGGTHYASVYRVAIHEREDFSLSSVRKSSTGCFKTTEDFEKNFKKITTIPDGSAAHCLMQCERSREVIAAWDSERYECWCGRFDDNLPETRLPKSSVDEMCDQRHCEKTSDCEIRYVRTVRTYSDDRRCESKGFLSKPNGRLTALASFPGSGNTWVRHLIESATGIYTGSVYSDMTLYNQGFVGEILSWKSRRTSVIKTHKASKAGLSGFEAAIVIVRNPYNAFVAEFNRMLGGHVGHADPVFFKTKEWEYYVVYKLEKWLKLIRAYAPLQKVHISYFEHIVADAYTEVKSMTSFLEIPIEDLEGRLHCLRSNLGGNFKRPSRKLEFDPFTKPLREKVNLVVREARFIMEKYGLPDLPDYER